MSQVSKYPISKGVTERIFTIFTKTILAVENEKEADNLLEDLLTPTEKVMLAKRLAIAYLLDKGYDYRTIRETVRVSAPTIAHVNTKRQYGSKGYQQCIAKISRDEAIKNFFDKAVEKAISLPAKSTKGGGMWRYLEQEVKRNKKQNPF